MSSLDSPYILDPSGRTLWWVMFDLPDAMKSKDAFARSKLMLCPRPNTGHVPVPTRPFAKHDGYTVQLGDEVHQWLLDAKFPYQIDYRWCSGLLIGVRAAELGWHAGFIDEAHAVAFKLAFGLA